MFVLTRENSIANQFLAELRDRNIQQDRMRFRKNIERLGEIMAYEVSKTLSYESKLVETPLATLKANVIKAQPVLISILRAGLPYFNGFLNFFDRADCGYIGAYRQEDENNLTIKLGYVATPPLDQRTVILIDPMLATGRSIIDSVNSFIKNGTPSHIHVVSLVAAPEGVEYLQKNLDSPHSLWTCALDEKLNDQFYIVPGLGDAGDLSFGIKM